MFTILANALAVWIGAQILRGVKSNRFFSGNNYWSCHWGIKLVIGKYP